jgi:hypothetical protein
MKWFWIFLAAVTGIAIVVAFQPPRGARTDPRATDAEAIERLVSEAVAPAPAPTPAARPAATAAEELVRDLSTPRADEASKPIASEAGSAKPTRGGPVEGERLTDGLDRTIPNATVKPSELVRKPDGTIVADGTWEIRGAGTEANPYVVPWELLTSAMDTYQPRAEMRDIPQRIAFLDGKRVRIEGYIVFPLIVQQVQQLLVTYNQWDGCCIGVPPSAYDAIEVNLSSSIPINRRHGLLFGGVEGILHVAPLLSDGWIYGLYAMDDARLKLEL